MGVPSRQLERASGRMLDRGESLQVASRVQLVHPTAAGFDLERGKVVLALTDRRLLTITTSWFNRSRLVGEWPAGGIRCSVSHRRIGSSLIHVHLASGGRLSFEWLGGHPAREWGYQIHR